MTGLGKYIHLQNSDHYILSATNYFPVLYEFVIT